MKILILSCNTGEGHNSAGKAVMEAALLRGHEVEFMDLMLLGGKIGLPYGRWGLYFHCQTYPCFLLPALQSGRTDQFQHTEVTGLLCELAACRQTGSLY